MNKLQEWKTNLSRKQRVLLLVLVVVVVLALLAATVFRDNAVAMLRWATYSQQDDNFAHNAQANSLFLGLEDDLLICTQTQIQLVSPTGTPRLRETVSMNTPALNASGDYAVVYDVGGQELRVIGGGALVHSLTLTEEESILCASINEDGWVAVTTKISGYKGVVTVYNRDFEAVMTIRLSSRYISDAVVTPDCQGVYLISPGQAEGSFENTLLYYTFSSNEAPTRTLSLGSNVILSSHSASRCWLLGDKSLVILDSRVPEDGLPPGGRVCHPAALPVLLRQRRDPGHRGRRRHPLWGSHPGGPAHGPVRPGARRGPADHRGDHHRRPEAGRLPHQPQPAGRAQPGGLFRRHRGPHQQRRCEPLLPLHRGAGGARRAGRGGGIMVPAVSLLLDLVLLGLLVFSFVMGVRRGFLLSLCSLLAVLVALLGGWYLAAHWSQPLEERLEPVILETLTQREAEEETTSPLPDNLPQALQDQAAQTAQDWKNATLAQAAAFLAGAAAKVILFLAGFFVVLLLWNLLFHALNLVAKLPGLHGLNKFFGGALGLVKGLLLLMLARWVLCDLLGWIPADVTRDSILLSLLPSLDLFALLEGTLPSIHT